MHFLKSHQREVEDLPDIDWDNLSYAITPTDYIYLTKCARGENFSGGLRCYGNGTIDMSVSSGILNNGQGLLEGLKAYRKQDGGILLFRPEENALRMKMGAARLLMECPSVEQFVNAVKEVVLANQRWVPPFKKGALYIRPLLFGSGSILPPAPSPECTFLIFVSPVGNYFKGNLSPIHLVVSTEYHRATRGGAGGVKTIGNYSAVFMAQANAISSGFNEVLYLDSVHKKYLEEVSACNIFVVKGKSISTPPIDGTILPGITRKSVIDIARNEGYQVVERRIGVEELSDADEVFGTGCGIVIAPIGSITYLGKRMVYGDGGVGKVSQQMYSILTGIQYGLMADKMGWTVKVK
ncbi:branched-chain amino acid aminotransferase 2, chloroplastic isoform X2 [Amborella trichopoda]|uniref:branched-chain amino acid aminotransferase 2, chloroplastic isoform X2 n=1 Tax=Amborella trichopoda TaxID=13333 RepID=UPI0005D373D6|nr:branched-chain amino acid aminotransferase 2, chloroplastic isoform X2 [Amborella trichopoda]|eukprot:XP_006855774.2 branched-chain amino acid aminotransferase 2, chloroplastic isoform X2 [Amborella trichopoda]